MATSLFVEWPAMMDKPASKLPVDAAGFAAWMKAEREALGWSTTTLADHARALAHAEGNMIALTQQTISGFEQGEAKRIPQWMRYVRKAFDGDVAKPAPTITSKLAVQRQQEPDQPPMRKADEGTVSLKVVDLNLAMGDGGNLDDWADEESVEFDLNLLRSITRSPAARVIVVRPRGDSMFPTLLNGDWVLIDTTQRTLNLDDKIWACSVYGAGAVKRLKAIGKSKVEVRSDNPIAGNREVDAGDLVILGRVIWIGREA